MEQEKNKNGIVALLVVIIVILLTLVVLLATGTISLKSDNVTDNNNNQTNENNKTSIQENDDGTNNTDDNNQQTSSENNIQDLIDSVKVTEMTFDKPHGSKFGGETSYTLETNMAVKLECKNNDVRGITVKGYCLDTSDNKYLFSGPRGVIAFYCNNDPSYSSDTKFVQAYQLFKTDGSNYVIPDKTTDINWENIEIKYCKFDEAHLILSDYSELSTKMNLNFEKEFK